MRRRYPPRHLTLPAPRLTWQGVTTLAVSGGLIWSAAVILARVVLAMT